MPYTSPYFNSTFPGQSSEQSLVDDLVREQIKIYGIDVRYMPRRHLNLDKLLHESTKNAFEFAMPIPMYLKTVDGFDNGMEVLTKFGVRSSDEVTLVMSRSEFIAYYSPFIKSYYNALADRPDTEDLNPLDGETDQRPKEGDLIFFPFDNSIFEVKYVNFDQPFFQLGRGYVFEIQCEKFEYSGETFETGYEDIDRPQTETEYYRLEFDLLDSTIEIPIEKNDIISSPQESSIILNDLTFEKLEKVRLYNLSDAFTYLSTEGLQLIVNEIDTRLLVGSTPTLEEMVQSIVNNNQLDETFFRLYKDPGFIERVSDVTARVMDWDKPKLKLVLGDFNNLDPVQRDLYKDVTNNKYDVVLIVGEKSTAKYLSYKATSREMAADDTNVIQKEFDDIKIIDFNDESPFGFV